MAPAATYNSDEGWRGHQRGQLREGRWAVERECGFSSYLAECLGDARPAGGDPLLSEVFGAALCCLDQLHA